MKAGVVFASCASISIAALVGQRLGMDAGATLCLGILSALGVMLVGGWVDAVIIRARRDLA